MKPPAKRPPPAPRDPDHHCAGLEREALMFILKKTQPQAWEAIYDAVYRGVHVDVYWRAVESGEVVK